MNYYIKSTKEETSKEDKPMIDLIKHLSKATDYYIEKNFNNTVDKENASLIMNAALSHAANVCFVISIDQAIATKKALFENAKIIFCKIIDSYIKQTMN